MEEKINSCTLSLILVVILLHLPISADATEKAEMLENLNKQQVANKAKPQRGVEAKQLTEEIKKRKIELTIIEPEMVRLPIGISMGKYEVTQEQWRAVNGNNPSYFKDCGDTCPVEEVSWNEIQGFIAKLNQHTGKHYRLPTEDEWYAACQAGSKTEYCGSNDIDAVAWFLFNSDHTQPTGKKSPNAWGLYDMSGNVREWTDSCYDGDCSRRVIRGGSWALNSAFARASDRYWNDPAYHNYNLGFRLVLTD